MQIKTNKPKFTLHLFKNKSAGFISLKEAAKISGYAPDYIGWLIREGRINGEKIYSEASLQTTKEAVLAYKNRNRKTKEKLLKTTPKKSQKFIPLKEAAKISGYAPDYIGWLIRKGKIPGGKIYNEISWQVNEASLRDYQKLKHRHQRFFKIIAPRLKLVKRIAKNAFGLGRNDETRSHQIFNVGWRFVFVTIIIFFFVSGFAPVRFLQGSLISALSGGETQTINFYSTIATGTWQNSENVQGPPDVLPDGEINSFSEENSAVYKTGPLTLICENFEELPKGTSTEATSTIIEEATSTENILTETSTSTPETATSVPDSESVGTGQATSEATSTPAVEEKQEPIQQEVTSTEEQIIETPVETATTTLEAPVSFLDKIKSFFGFKVLAQENTFSAKIKFSFAIGEKTPDIIIEPTSTTTNEIQNNGTSSDESVSFWDKVKKFFSDLTFRATLIVKAQEDATNSEIIINEAKTNETTTPASIIEEATNTETTATETTIQEIATTTIEATSTEEANITEATTTEVTTTEATTTEEIISNLDAKIVIWWSLDGINWQQLVTVSNYPFSNFLNGGYFEYDAPFLKNFEDVKNLKIKFEGVIGGETKFAAYLDSVWVEVKYQEKQDEEEFELRAIKKDWRADETPEFEVVPRGQKAQENIVEKLAAEVSSVFEEKPGVEVTLINPGNEELSLREGKDFSAETHSPTRIKIFKSEDFRPGLHKLKINYEKNGKTYNLEQDFTWGVLAINTNKSIYLPGDQAYLQMAALKDDGHTICGASLRLQILNPKSEILNLSTENGTIQYSGECGPNNVTDVPDYFAYYQIGEAGFYQMKLTNLDNGYEITDSFEVKESVPFDVERIGPTRIWPMANYEMTLRIKVNQDFKDEVIESLPESFKILDCQNCQVETGSLPNLKRLRWEVDWKTGEIPELKYRFKTPDVSPYLYLLGPLKISDFQEARQWQVAADSPVIYTYNFSTCTYDINCWAYEKGATTTTFTSPNDTGNGEATTIDYTAISSSNNNRWTTSLSPLTGQYDSQMYKFKISQPTSTISQLDFKWEGFGEYNQSSNVYDTTFYTWNYTSLTWDQLNQVYFTSTTDQELTGTTTVAGHVGGTGNNEVTLMTKTKEGADTTAPEKVTDLSATTTFLVGFVDLKWTAPHEDGSIGGAVSQYQIRYATTSAITDANWNSANICGGTPPSHPGTPGSTESFTCTGLASSTHYYFGLKSADEVPNWSLCSNSPDVTTTAGSCPFIYVWNGKEYEFVAETVTPFVVPEAEAPFLSVLPNLVPKDGKYLIKIKEELPETSFLNNLFLLAIDHPKDTEVYPDIFGNIHTIKDKISASSCINEEGEDCLNLFKENDNKFWNWGDEEYWKTHKNTELDQEGNLISDDESDLYSWAVLTFPKPKDAEQAKLVWYTMEHPSVGWAWEHFKNLLGYNHPEILQKYIDNGMLEDWFLNESAIIRLDVWDGKEWKPEYNLLEASALKKPTRFSHQVDVSGIPGDELKIRFKSIYGYRAIDSVKVDYSKDYTLIPYLNVIPSYPEKAIVNGESVLGAISKIDDKRVVIDQGEEMYLEFPEKYKLLPNTERNYILVTTGYYFGKYDKIIAKPNTELAERIMTEPGFTPRYFIPRWFGESETKFNEIEDKEFKCSPYFSDPQRGCELPLVVEKEIKHFFPISKYTIFDKIRIASQIIVILIIIGVLVLLIKKKQYKKLLLVLIILGVLLSLWSLLKVYKEFRVDKGSIVKEAVQVKKAVWRVPAPHCSLNTDYIELKVTIFDVGVSGKVYSDEGSSALLTGPIVSIAVDGTFYASTTASTTDGSYSFSNVTTTAGVIFHVYLDNSSEKGVTVTRSADTVISDLNIYQNRIIVRYEDSGPITIADLDKYDSTNDPDILYTASSTVGTLTASSASEFFIWSGKTFGSWGTAGAGGTISLADLDIRGTFTATSTQAINVSSNWFASSTATAFNSASSTVTFTSTVSTTTIKTAGSPFYNLTFNGSGGSWTFQEANATTANNFTISNGTVTSTSAVLAVGGNWLIESGGTFNHNNGKVLFNATAAKTITVGGSNFYQLEFNGSGGKWTFQDAATTTNDLTISNGTASSTYNMYVYGGDVTGNGTLNWASSTFMVAGTGNFGGPSNWNFYNLTFSGTTTATSTGTTTISNVLTIASSQTLSTGEKSWVLSGGGTPFVKTGTFTPATSTFYYISTANATVTAATYYNLNLSPAGTPTYNLAAGTITTNNYLTIGNGTNGVTVNADNNDPALDVDGSFTILANSTFIASQTGTFTVGSNWSNSGTFTHSNGTTTFDATTSGKTIKTGGSPFYNLTFNGSDGVWTFQDAATTTNDLTISNGTASSTYNMYVYGGDVTGNGTLNWASSTFMVAGTGNFGGPSNWNFYNLTFSGTTTATSTGTTTISNILTISSSQTLNAGSKVWEIAGYSTSITPFIIETNAVFNASFSTFKYTTEQGTNITATTYYNLELIGRPSVESVETLRPNAAGDYTNIDSQYPDSGAHCDKVDEETPDNASTYVSTFSATQQKDAYNLQDTGISGSISINSVKVYSRVKRRAQPFLRLSTNETAGSSIGSESDIYGGNIFATWGDDTYIYAGGVTTLTVRKYLKSDLSYIGQTASYGGNIYAIWGDDTYIYAGGATTLTVRKYLKSDLSYIGETASYGGIIRAILGDDTYIYVVGDTTRTVRKYLKSDLSYIGETASYGGNIFATWGDDTYIYVVGDTTQTVRKYLKSDLSYIGETASYGGSINTIWGDNTYIYAGGVTTRTVRKYLKSDLSYIGETASYGANINTIWGDDTYIYAGGGIIPTVLTVRKYLKSDLSYIGQADSYGGIIRASWGDDTYIYVVGDTTRTVRKYLKSDLSDWLTFSEILARPGGGSWAVSDLNSLQVAIGLQIPTGVANSYCTQIYVEVDYNTLTPVYTLATTTGQTFTVNNNLLVGDGVHPITVTATTNNPIIDVNGNITISASSTFVAPTSSSFTIAGNWSNSGTFTHSNGTITFDGATSSTSTISGVTTFYNLTATTTYKTLQFATGTSATTTVAGTLTLNGQTCETKIKLRSTQSGQQWYLNAMATTSINYVDVKDSNATGSAATIVANNSFNSGNNTNWTINPCVTVSGTVYTDEGTSTSTNGWIVSLAVDGTWTASTTASTTDGSYSFSATAGVIFHVYLDNSDGKGVTVTRSAGADISGLNIYQNRIIVRYENSGPITIADLDKYDSQQDSDILFTASSTAGTLTASSTSEFFVWAGKEFRAGPAAGTISLSDLDIRGTFTATSSQTISISGNWDVTTTATFNSASSTVEFTATSGKTIRTNGKLFYNLTFNGSDGQWTFQDAATTTNDLTISNGTASSTYNMYVYGGDVTGNGTLNWASSTFMVAGTGNFGGPSNWNFYNLTFSGTTTATSTGTTTISNILTISSSQTLNAGSKVWEIAGYSTSITPFIIETNAVFNASFSTFKYTTEQGTNITATTYYNLELIDPPLNNKNSTEPPVVNNEISETGGGKPAYQLSIPNGSGDETELFSFGAENWFTVSREDDDFVYGTGGDLYQLEDTPQAKEEKARPITKVRVYALCEGLSWTRIKTRGTVYEGEKTPATKNLIHTDYKVNPYTQKPWTWQEIDNLQAGVGLDSGKCYFVYVEVETVVHSQTFYPIDPVEVTPATTSAWTDVNGADFGVPAGATGVLLHLVNTNGGTDYLVGLREKGSTDDRPGSLELNSHWWAAIGVDANGTFQAYIENTTYIHIYLVGYTMSGVTFFVNGIDKSISVNGNWTDINCSAEAPGAIGLIFQITQGTDPFSIGIGMREKGSTDNRTSYVYGCSGASIIIGCDSSQICQGYINANYQYLHFYLIGYITDGAIFNTNATDVSLATPYVWTDLAPLPANSVMGFIEVYFGYEINFGLRKNGSSESIYRTAANHPWAFVESDANGVIEGKMDHYNDYNTNFFVVGYATGPLLGPTYTLGTTIGQTLTVNNNLTIGNGTDVMTVTGATRNPIIDVNGNVTISASATFVAPTSSSFTIAGNWSNSGTFTHSNGTTTFDGTTSGKTIKTGGSPFYDLTFNGSSGGWTFSDNATTTNNFTILNGTVIATSTLYVGGNWSATTTGVFQHNNGEVVFNATTAGHSISDGGWPFYKITFNGSGGEWLYQDSTSTAPATTTVQAGVATFLNAKTGGVSVTGGILNVDWYLGTHVVDADTTSHDINTTGTDPIVVSEASSSAAIWRHDGSNWIGPVYSTSTDSDDSGKNPQPDNNLAIRIREYTKDSASTTYYKFNLTITGQPGFSSYDYYSIRNGKYITSTSSSETSQDRSISQEWHRANKSAVNGTKDYDGVNLPPQHGTWYAGMTSDLQFSISSPTLNLILDQPTWTATGSTILYATTSYSNGYTVKTYATNLGRLRLGETENYINRWDYENVSPALWDDNCPSGSGYCGFGYTTSDTNLYNASSTQYDNRFADLTKYAGFATSSLSTDPVADSTSTAYGVATTIVYKVSVNQDQVQGDYTGTVFYICTANY